MTTGPLPAGKNRPTTPRAWCGWCRPGVRPWHWRRSAGGRAWRPGSDASSSSRDSSIPGRAATGAGLSALIAVGLATTVALAQTPAMTKARQRDESSRSDSSSGNAAKELRAIRHTIWGEVRDMAGNPVSGAAVFAVGIAEPKPEMVKGQIEQVVDLQKILGQTVSGRAGGFQLELRAGPEIESLNLVVKGPGWDLAAANFSLRPDDEGAMPFPLLPDESITLNLSKKIPIEGQLLSPTGQPVAGARVELLNLGSGSDSNKDRRWYLSGPERSR